MLGYKWIISCVLLLVCNIAAAQCLQPSFSIPDTVCINEPFNITNTSTGYDRYEWDFCSGDLEKEPSLQVVTTLSSAVIPTDITTVFDGVNWYGFVSSRDNNKILRLDYGSSLDHTPSVVDIGNPGNLLSRPEQMKIIKEGSDWIGIVVNLNNYISDFSAVRLNFGNSLTNIPTAIRLAALDPYLQMPRGIEIVNDQENTVVFIANAINNVITAINFGNSINNSIDNNHIINIPLPEAGSGLNVMGVSVIKDCDKWYGLASSFDNRIYKLDFGVNLFSKPAVSVLDVTKGLNLSPVKVVLTQDNSKYYALIMHYNGTLVELDFGKHIGNSEPIIKNQFTYVGDVVGAELVKFGSTYSFLSVDSESKNVIKFSFPNVCAASTPVSSSITTSNLHYEQGGIQSITLTAYDINGNTSTISDSVFVRPAVANEFTATKLCEGTAAQFTAPVAPAGNKITSWVWDFGDGNTSTAQHPIHQYVTSGTKNVSLTITDICNNSQTINKPVTIYQQSAPDFNALAEICSYEPVTFIEASTVVDDEIISWQWNFGNGGTDTSKNPTYTYTQSGNFQVTLTTTLKSGCTASISKSILIKPGARVDFSVQNACFGNQTSFSDLTTFAINTSLSSRVWDFGDGSTSTFAKPTHTYASTGSYTVTLTIQNDIGCVTTRTKQIKVTEMPKPDFSFSLACSGEPTNFFDESIAVGGSITQWQWHFNDPASGTDNMSSIRNPTHTFSTPGEYEVQLKIVSSNGCTDSLTKIITVIASPTAAFAYQVNCASQEVQFTDQSISDESNPITAWYWEMGDGTVSSEKNLTHTYTSPGSYTVNLVVTASSRCTNSYSQKIIIYTPPVADFSIRGNLCINTPVNFIGASISSDPVINWVWDFGTLGIFTDPQPQVTFSDTSLLTVPIVLTITTASGCVASIRKSVVLQNVPDAQFSYAPLSKETPLDIKFTSAPSPDVVAFEWDFGDGSTSKESDPTHMYTSSGSYTVQLTTSNAAGCTAKFSVEVIVSDIPSVFELKLETLSATISNNLINVSLRVYNNSTEAIETLQFNTITEENNPYIQLWNGSLKPGTVLNWAFAIPVSNTFSIPSAICVFAENQANKKTSNSKCVSLTDKFIVFNPSPNPAYDNIKLSFVVPNDGKIEINITDVLGKKIDNFKTATLKPGFNELEYNVWNMSKGLYYFRFSYEGNVQVRKVVIK